jgi:hypothetical protein
VRADLDRRLGEELGKSLLAGDASVPDERVLELLRRYLGPHGVDESSMLLAIEGFRRGGDAQSCARWASLLAEREERPLRRGLALWRETQCQVSDPEDREASARMLAAAEGGEAGPLAPAMAARAAERLLAHGDRDGALDAYRRALETFGEPRLASMLALRLGELLDDAGQAEEAFRTLLRGLASGSGDAHASLALRRHALVRLARLAPELGRMEELDVALHAELPAADGFWSSAFRHLGRWPRAADEAKDDPFARVAGELDLADELAPRVEAAIERVQAHERDRAEAAARALAADEDEGEGERLAVSSPPPTRAEARPAARAPAPPPAAAAAADEDEDENEDEEEVLP